MYPQSVPALMSKNVGNSLSNYSTWNSILYNVFAYKAKGNGIADDSAAISAAIAAVKASGGGTLFLPPGTYIISSRLFIPSNVVIEGVKGKSTIKMSTSAGTSGAIVNEKGSAGGDSNITIKGIDFIGNGLDPITPPLIATSALIFYYSNDILIEDCTFTKFRGLGVSFQGGTNTQVIRCKFFDHGRDLTPFRGTIGSVPVAVWAAFGNKGLRVIDCEFVDCRFSAVFMLGTHGLISGCRMDTIGESAIYSETLAESPTGYNVVTNNTIHNCYMVDVNASGIEWTSPYSVVANNIIDSVDGDCIGFTTANYVTIKNNVLSNPNRSGTLNGSGIGISMNPALSPRFIAAGTGIIVEGNVIFDGGVPVKMQYGIRIFSFGGGFPMTNCSIVNNQVNRIVVSELHVEPGLMEDDTNIIKNNAGWLDVQKSATPVTTNAPSYQVLKYFTVPANSMGKTRGIRVEAWGTVTGTAGTKTIGFKFDTFDAEFAFITYTAAESGKWRMEGVIVNRNATNVQTRSAISYKETTVIQFESAGAIDTTVNKNVALLGTCANAADSIKCDGLIVERI